MQWRTRLEVAMGIKPDLRYLFRFGCLCRVLKPLETRKHKFDTHAEDCVYLGPAYPLDPMSRGTRFLRLSTRTVIVRHDVVVYPDTMPFRSTGGKTSKVDTTTATDASISYFVAWSPDGDQTPPPVHEQTPTTPSTNVHAPANASVSASISPVPIVPIGAPTPALPPPGDAPHTPSPDTPSSGCTHTHRIRSHKIRTREGCLSHVGR